MDAFGDRLGSLRIARAVCVWQVQPGARAGQGESIAWSAPQREDLCLRSCWGMRGYCLGIGNTLGQHRRKSRKPSDLINHRVQGLERQTGG